MTNVADMARARRALREQIAPRLPDGPEPPDNAGMEHRVTALETRLDTVLPTLATKSDVGDLRADFKGWTLTTALTIVGTMVAGFIGIATLLMRQPPTQGASPQPVIITVPATALPPPSAPEAK